MVECQFSEKYYNLLKTVELSEIRDSIVFDDKERKLTTPNYQLLKVLITEEICRSGMGSNQEPNERGRDLESLYDLLLFDAKEYSV